MARLRGTWAIEWADDDGNHVLELRTPLMRPRPAANIVAYTRDSLDRTTREVSYLGAGVHEAIADIRFQEDAQVVLDMLLAGAKGKTLNVIPNVDDPDRQWACYLISPTAAQLEVMTDADAGALELHQVTIRLRRTNGKAFS